ncbi:MAG TPA: hypothetical protein VK308_07790 [Pyrinomonadaceae bacterium]|nr:hypothetical protein [Pyrinomonadaceae bacterium]
MVQATLGQINDGYTDGSETRKDIAESVLATMDKSTKQATGISLFHILTIGSIGASIALFLSGKRMEGIFVGLWAPTFEALKTASDKSKNS